MDYGNGRTFPETWYFEDKPTSGFKYFYKVRGYSISGTTGPDSKAVEVLIAEEE